MGDTNVQLQQQPVPYKTYYVSQACEWKSNLFVPKSNDILFAQQQVSSSRRRRIDGDDDDDDGDLLHPPTSAFSKQRRQVLLNNNRQQQVAVEPIYRSEITSTGVGGVDSQMTTTTTSIVMSTSSKALVLALWPTQQQSTRNFNGYEQACSIRLIVPRNMRILAKLSSRKLTFTEEYIEQQVLAPGGDELRPEFTRALWFNVSQSEFSETEHRTFESDSNVLAFRFLLERFASKRVPEMRFQLVLTAFQTLGANEGLNLWNQSPAIPQVGTNPATGGDHLNGNAQFICDSQRLISANLACDGYKNCQDGHDEEPATCFNAINPTTTTTTSSNVGPKKGPTSTQQVAVESNLILRTLKQLQSNATDGSGSLAGFLLGFLLVLLLLTCCSCCLYCLIALWRRYLAPLFAEDSQETLERRRRDLLRKQIGAPLQHEQEGGLLVAAERQNQENLARQKALETSKGAIIQPQSILKKAPLARFETLRHHDQAAASVSALAPAPPPRRGALASSLTSSSGRQRKFVPPKAAQRVSRQQQQQQQHESRQDKKASELSFTSHATRVEQSSSFRRGLDGEAQQRVTNYVYSEDTAKYSESYLVSRSTFESGLGTGATPARDYVNLSEERRTNEEEGHHQAGHLI